jgi:hypothetical protein
MNQLELIGESIWNTYRSMASLLEGKWKWVGKDRTKKTLKTGKDAGARLGEKKAKVGQKGPVPGSRMTTTTTAQNRITDPKSSIPSVHSDLTARPRRERPGDTGIKQTTSVHRPGQPDVENWPHKVHPPKTPKKK